MKVKNVIINNAWSTIKDLALNTISKENKNNSEPTSEWKRKILLSEHSPIRYLNVKWTWKDIPYFVSTHFVRHKIGCEHFVSTQRTDRTNVDRNNLPQNNPVNHTMFANAQAMINISRKRLCTCASKETRDAWKEVLNSIKDVEPELYKCCVKECIYRGWCYEYKSCEFHKTEEFTKQLSEYRRNINE